MLLIVRRVNYTQHDEKHAVMKLIKMSNCYKSMVCTCIGLMSGLTMGLLSLDIVSLEVLKRSGKPRQQKYAGRIINLVRQHHLLLVTLLLANAAAVESMPIFLDKITNEIVAILISVTAVLVFGE